MRAGCTEARRITMRSDKAVQTPKMSRIRALAQARDVIHSGRTSLNGLKVRFWHRRIRLGPRLTLLVRDQSPYPIPCRQNRARRTPQLCRSSRRRSAKPARPSARNCAGGQAKSGARPNSSAYLTQCRGRYDISSGLVRPCGVEKLGRACRL